MTSSQAPYPYQSPYTHISSHLMDPKDRSSSPGGINALSPSSDAIFQTEHYRSSFPPIGSAASSWSHRLPSEDPAKTSSSVAQFSQLSDVKGGTAWDSVSLLPIFCPEGVDSAVFFENGLDSDLTASCQIFGSSAASDKSGKSASSIGQLNYQKTRISVGDFETCQPSNDDCSDVDCVPPLPADLTNWNAYLSQKKGLAAPVRGGEGEAPSIYEGVYDFDKSLQNLSFEGPPPKSSKWRADASEPYGFQRDSGVASLSRSGVLHDSGDRQSSKFDRKSPGCRYSNLFARDFQSTTDGAEEWDQFGTELEKVSPSLAETCQAPREVGPSQSNTSRFLSVANSSHYGGSLSRSQGTPIPSSKHSSRIILISNYSSNMDQSYIRSLFSQYGPIRNITPYGGSMLIGFYDLRHSQKAMCALNGKCLPCNRTLELYYHFLRDASLIGKENQGTLVIFNLDPLISNSEIANLFEKYGEIKEIRESPNHKHRFVEFYDVICAEKAMKALNKSELCGRKIKIEPSRPGGSLTSFTNHANNHQPSTSPPQHTERREFKSAGSTEYRMRSNSSDYRCNKSARTNRKYSNGSDFQSPTGSGPSAGFQSKDFERRQRKDCGVYALKNPYEISPGKNSDGGLYDRNFVPKKPQVPSSTHYSGLMPPNYYPAHLNDTSESFQFLGTESQIGSSLSVNDNLGFLNSQNLINNSAITPSFSNLNNDSISSFPVNLNNSVCSFSKPLNCENLDGTYSSHLSIGNGFGKDRERSLLNEFANLSVVPGDGVTTGAFSPKSIYGFPSSSYAAIQNPDFESTHAKVSNNLPRLCMDLSHLNFQHYEDSLNNDNFNASSSTFDVGEKTSSTNNFSNNFTECELHNSSELANYDTDSLSLCHSNFSTSNQVCEYPDRFDILIDSILSNSDKRTTLMIKNIPNKYDQEMLLLAVDKQHIGLYDFFYLPIDFKNKCNVGYAFINFINPLRILSFYEEFNDRKWEKFNSEKVCRISYARIQGKSAMIEHFKNSSIMFEDPKCRPLIFCSDGVQMGRLEAFPVGSNVRPRNKKENNSSARAYKPKKEQKQ